VAEKELWSFRGMLCETLLGIMSACTGYCPTGFNPEWSTNPPNTSGDPGSNLGSGAAWILFDTNLGDKVPA